MSSSNICSSVEHRRLTVEHKTVLNLPHALVNTYGSNSQSDTAVSCSSLNLSVIATANVKLLYCDTGEERERDRIEWVLLFGHTQYSLHTQWVCSSLKT